MITDTAFYRNDEYHRRGDTADRLDYVRMSRVVSAVDAGIRALEWSRSAGGTASDYESETRIGTSKVAWECRSNEPCAASPDVSAELVGGMNGASLPARLSGGITPILRIFAIVLASTGGA